MIKVEKNAWNHLKEKEMENIWSKGGKEKGGGTNKEEISLKMANKKGIWEQKETKTEIRGRQKG